MVRPQAMLLVLLLSHVVLDFFLPIWRSRGGTSTRVVRRMAMAAIHGLTVAAVVWVVRHDWGFAGLAGGAIALAWSLASALVPRAGMKAAWPFVIEQSIHVSALTAVWLTSEGDWSQVPVYFQTLTSAQNLLVLLAYFVMLRPSSVLVSSLLGPLLAKANNKGTLKNAGTFIGYLERILILTFVLLTRWDAIGFLLAAKSILRFNEIKGTFQRSMSEYVLLGTLLSFALSIGAGLLVTSLLDTNG